MAKLPVHYRKSSETLLQVDFLDQFLGVGFVKIHTIGLRNSSGNVYALTTNDTLIAHEENQYVDASSSIDIDYDLDINQNVVVAGVDCIVQARVQVDTGNTAAFSFNLKKVDSDGTETSMGSVTSDTLTGAASDEHFLLTTKLSLTRTVLKKGDKLRLTVTNPTVGGASDKFFHSPSFWTTTESVTYINSSFFLLPVEVDQ